MRYKIDAIFIWLDILSQKSEVCIWNISLRHFINKFQKLLSEIFINNECFSLNRLQINGDVLKDIGYEGIEIGFELDKLLDIVINDPDSNNPLDLSYIARNDFYEIKNNGIPFTCITGEKMRIVL